MNNVLTRQKRVWLEIILVPRAPVSFGHVVGETAQIKRVALGTRMARDRRQQSRSQSPQAPRSAVLSPGETLMKQSRSQSPRAPRSADGRPGETLGKWNFLPQKSGVPVVVRMLC